MVDYIHFKTKRVWRSTKYKEAVITNEKLNVSEKVKTGIPEEVIIHNEEIWLRKDEIKSLTHYDKSYKINDYEVDEEQFNKILKEITYGTKTSK